MAEPPSYPDPGDDTGTRPDRGSAAGGPRWVPVLGVIAVVVLVLLVVVVHLIGVIGSGVH